MLDQDLPCIAADAAARPIHTVRPATLQPFLASLPPGQAGFLRDGGFTARADELILLPGGDGIAGAVLGLGDDRSPFAFGSLPFRLPEGNWRLEAGDFDASAAVLGFCLGGYRYGAFKPAKRASARLVVPPGHERALSQAAAAWMVRDLVNAPANLLGPAELADVALDLGRRHGADVMRVSGEALTAQYPTVATVGRGADRAPVVAGFSWRGSAATDSSPLVWLCGKGVCFDSGGYDLKPAAGMLRMKKDMGGAATVLGIARILMEADLPLRLAVRIGCVENSVSGQAFRPMDVIRTRRGLTVEVGNTDAEGRLVLCDLLAEASDEKPDLLLDCATLTGAARVAVGPDLPALFANDEAWAESFLGAGMDASDPMWRLPLWDGYDAWLDSPVADLNNVSSKPFAGAVVAALFMRRFLAPGTPWAHLDLYAWNDTTRPGRPEGGEALGMRAACLAIERKLFTT
ncbi:leucyl aminopeptidase family protein [Limobrevibacterium gyesilva]|uniref:Leucyl aminopeptidase family protein n=1 Tax=Limobrevibacterium gyesilva TaxID=2991712 RepID=A0AA41YKA0_9PROT|nr:leucyl aminopeptidase family protein [Limobrevibacterium gyesilva]MCW3473398.1 leucyl aminopeptidase family protein [Limobrevibacterium gyesilva]